MQAFAYKPGGRGDLELDGGVARKRPGSAPTNGFVAMLCSARAQSAPLRSPRRIGPLMARRTTEEQPDPVEVVGARSVASVRAARFLALSVDAIQIIFLPIFSAGGLSWANDVLDLLTSLVMIRLLGWHLAFLPTFLIELLPLVDLAPTWTIAVWLVTRRRSG
jgi:hypothetical protein